MNAGLAVREERRVFLSHIESYRPDPFIRKEPFWFYSSYTPRFLLSSSSQTLDSTEKSEPSLPPSLCTSHHFITRISIGRRIATEGSLVRQEKQTMNTQGQVVRYARGGRRRKEVLNVDLNVPPPVENQEQVGGPAVSVAQGGQGGVPAILVAHGWQGHQPAGSTQPAPIDVEELDDDVIISSPRAFEEVAKNKSRRSRRTLVVDVESEGGAVRLGLNQGNKRRRGSAIPPVINCERYVNLEGSSDSM
ncbi:hypothetical protein Ccrd_003716, partial [Cynara cardunculus var. scolymus]